MGMITAIDVSIDQPNKNFLVVAGFASKAEEWERFDKVWRETAG